MPAAPPLPLQSHLARVGEERCAFVRAMVFANAAMQSRAALQREADNWLAEAGTVPPGAPRGGGWHARFLCAAQRLLVP